LQLQKQKPNDGTVIAYTEVAPMFQRLVNDFI